MKSVILSLLLVGVAYSQYSLVFEEEFDDLDLDIWKPEITLGGGGNWEFQVYNNNRSTSYTKDGILYLNPILLADAIGEENVRGNYRMDLWGSSPADICTGNGFYGCERTSGYPNYLNPINSARLRTIDSVHLKYGKVEIRAQTPKGDWLWPAIWMLPTNNKYGQWPASGEIDIMESRGNEPVAGWEGADTVSSAMHWGPHFPENGYPMTTRGVKKDGGGLWSSEFHTYTVEWSSTFVRTYVDDIKILDVDMSSQSFWDRGGWNATGFDNPWANGNTNSPFDQPFYLIFNVAVGGTTGFFEDGYPGKPWSNQADNSINQFYDAKDQWLPSWQLDNPAKPAAMKIDWVRMYCNTNEPGSCGEQKKKKFFSN